MWLEARRLAFRSRSSRANYDRAVTQSGRILLVEDDREIASALVLELRHEGYQVVTARNEPLALHAAAEVDPDLIILGVLRSGSSAIEVCRRLRSRSTTPILIITGRACVRDRVDGLEAGADDHVIKPFSLEEFLARVRAYMQRFRRSPVASRIEFADLSLDTEFRQVTRQGRPIELTRREFDVLEVLLRHPGVVLSRQAIFEQVWGYGPLGASNLIDVYIGHLRRKIDDDFEPKLLHTIRGVGYSLRFST
jgi:DNA-binding response OmpR family regulator